MDEKLLAILNMLPQPAFLMKEGQILWCNGIATSLRLQELPAEYLFGCHPSLLRLQDPQSKLQLTLTIQEQSYAATLQAWDDQLLVIASPIAAEQENRLPFSDALRRPMQELISAAGTLFEELPDQRSTRMTGAAAEVNRAIYQIQRLCTHTCEGGKLLFEDHTPQRRSRYITEILDHFAQSCLPLVTAAGYQFTYEPMAVPVAADVDGQLFERALYQLLANAMAFTPKGGSIRLSCEKQDRLFLIHLADNGEGFRPEVLASLYAGNKRGTSSDPRSGIGMGLPVVKRIAELHGGSLTLQSSSSGTVATLSISLARSSVSLCSVIFHTDPYGGHNPALVELSSVLPAELYDPEEIES